MAHPNDLIIAKTVPNATLEEYESALEFMQKARSNAIIDINLIDIKISYISKLLETLKTKG